MDIRIYTDLEDTNYVSIDLSSLIHAYQYAIRVKDISSANLLKPLFSKGEETSKLEKTSPIYTFLKTCPNVKVDELGWEQLMRAFLKARLQNNKTALRYLGTALGHFENYVKENNELDGLIQELVLLPKEMHDYIQKNQDIENYIKNQKENAKGKTNKEKITNRSVVEIGNFEKIYKKSA